MNEPLTTTIVVNAFRPVGRRQDYYVYSTIDS